MNKCPKCNNSLSSSDVLCPKCGALVEEINTSVHVNVPSVEKPAEDSSQSSSYPDHYENIILYNETFPIIDSEPPAEKTEEAEVPEKEDALADEVSDIDDIFNGQGASKHVNPLLAHLEKQRSGNQSVYKEPIDEDADEDNADEVSDYEDDNDEYAALEDDAVLSDNEEDDSAVSSDEPSDDFDDLTDEYPEEKFTEDEKELAVPIAISELEKIARELSMPADEKPIKRELSMPADEKPIEKASVDNIPSYSKSYLDALRSEDIPEVDEAELEEDFDPQAYMEKFRAESTIEEKPEPAEIIAVEPEKAPVEEPVRRRYNPNRAKPKYEEPEEPKDENPPAAEEPKEEPEKEAEKPEPVKETKKDKSKKKAKEEEEVLELELEPERFFLDEISDEDTKNEQFVIEREDPTPEPASVSSVAYNYDSGDDNSFVAPLSNPPASKKKRLPAWASVLIWLIVAAAIFFGAYIFDRHVRSNYDNYGNFIYEITDGKIDVGGSSSK